MTGPVCLSRGSGCDPTSEERDNDAGEVLENQVYFGDKYRGLKKANENDKGLKDAGDERDDLGEVGENLRGLKEVGQDHEGFEELARTLSVSKILVRTLRISKMPATLGQLLLFLPQPWQDPNILWKIQDPLWESTFTLG